MRFYLWIKQRDQGCDYTIGCGERVEVIEALTKAHAVAAAKEIVLRVSHGEDSYRRNDDRDIQDAILFEASSSVSIDVQAIYSYAAKQMEKELQVEHERSERAEFERLRQKYG